MKNPPTTTRRNFLALTAAITAGLSSYVRGGQNTALTANPEDLTELSALDAVTAMRDGSLKAEDFAAALLRRCEEGSAFNAFITLDPQRVLEDAREADRQRAAGATLGPLHGLPIPVKDSVNTKAYPTTGGTLALRNFYPREDAPVVTQLLAAGAIVMGKTNIHELSFGWTSNNHAFGPVRNPYDASRIPGGSSGGTAAAVASGMAPLGVAEDTQGSIRVPAGMCGICGFRPTTRRYPTRGVIPISPLFDQVGPHARNVRDLALFDHVITREPQVKARESLRGVRLGLSPAYYLTDLDPEVERIFQAVSRRLTDAGAELVSIEVPNLQEVIELTTAQVQLFDVRPQLIKYLKTYCPEVSFDELVAQASPDIKDVFAQYVLPGGEFAVPEEVFIAARDVHLPALRQTMHDYYVSNRIDALVFPMAQIAATPIGQELEIDIAGKSVGFETAISRNIAPGSTAGLPGLVVPAGLTSGGLPVCIELDGPQGSDRALLALGQAVEQVLGPIPPPPIRARA